MSVLAEGCAPGPAVFEGSSSWQALCQPSPAAVGGWGMHVRVHVEFSYNHLPIHYAPFKGCHVDRDAVQATDHHTNPNPGCNRQEN